MKSFPKLMSIGFLTLVLFISGCTAPKQAKASELQADLSVREIKSDMADFRYHLNSYQVELQIFEGKVSNQELAIGELREQFLEVSHSEREIIESKLASLEKKLVQLENHDDSVLADLKKLKALANSTTSSLEQFKTQIDLNEKLVLKQNRDIESLDNNIATIMNLLYKQDGKTLDPRKHYAVKEGDSLEPMAAEEDAKVDQLIEKNELSNEALSLGQEPQTP